MAAAANGNGNGNGVKAEPATPAAAAAAAPAAAAAGAAPATAAAGAADVKVEVPAAAVAAAIEKRIAEVLKSADLGNLSTKLLREQLGAEFAIDLNRYRQWFGAVISKHFAPAAAAEAGAAAAAAAKPEPPKPVEMTEEEKDRIMAEQLQAEEQRPRRGAASESYRKASKRKAKEEKAAGGGDDAPAKPARKKRPPKTFQLTPAMAEFVGTDRMTRGDVTKAIWKYIKEKGLQVEGNKRKITCDDKLKALFGKDRKTIDMFKMTAAVAKHICKDGELIEPGADASDDE